MKRMTTFLALAVVVGVMALGPTAAWAAPMQGGSVALDHASGKAGAGRELLRQKLDSLGEAA